MGTFSAAAMAVVLFGAAAGKLFDRGNFNRYMEPLLGRRSSAARSSIVCIEILLAGVLAAAAFLGVVRVAAGCASALFLLVATGAHAAVVARGGATRCQCFGVLAAQRGRLERNWWDAPVIALRNGILVTASLGVFTENGFALVLCSLLPSALLAGGLRAMLIRDRTALLMPLHPGLREQAANVPLLQAQTWWVDGRPRRF